MKVDVSEKFNAVVISLKDKMVGGPDAEEFNNLIHKFIDDNKKNIILDMGGLKFVNSSGIGIIIRGYTTVSNAEGKMVLANLTDKTKGLLSITKLNQVFELYETVDDAVKGFE